MKWLYFFIKNRWDLNTKSFFAINKVIAEITCQSIIPSYVGFVYQKEFLIFSVSPGFILSTRTNSHTIGSCMKA